MKFDAAGTALWLMGQKSSIAGLFTQGDAKADVELVSILASELARNGEPEGIFAAIWLLTEGVPEAHRAAVNEGDGAAQTAMALMSTKEEKTASAILDWLEKAKPPITVYACLNANPALPEAIRQRAKKIAGG
jgi:hypothetical protein